MWLAAPACMLAFAACGGAGTGPPTPALQGAPIPPTPAPEIALHDQQGNRVSLSSLQGNVVVLSFLGSKCGSTCDVIAQQIRGALDEAGGGAVKVVIVSAEPHADTPASVKAFLERNDLAGRVLYLTGSPQQLRTLYEAYHVHPPEIAGAARFDEYAFVLVIDRAGRERAIFEAAELTPEALATDIRRLGG
jgi:cytochrome oxidase Cu insertion factor (SCO1/SenC/PrrC family)